MSPWRRLAVRDRRALVLGAVVLMPVLLFRGVVRPYARARAALGERVRVQRDLLARELAVLADARSLRERRARLDASLAADAPRLFPGTEPYAATADLVSYVGETARRNRVQVQDLQGRSAAPATQAEGLTRVQVELRGETDFEGVLRLLQTIERGPRLVRVDALAIERSGADPGGRETLTLRAALSGYSATASAPVRTASRGP
jgi:type II secretion system (T2SS) protein M